jgi:ankyrin repeat protein
LLTELGANINVSDFDGVTALMRAVYEGHDHIVRYLTQKGADVNTVDNSGATEISRAVGRLGYAAAQYLLDGGATLNSSVELIAAVQLLVKAAENGHLDFVQSLVNAGVNVNSQDHFGETALSTAVIKKHVAIAQFLVTRGADPTTVTTKSARYKTSALREAVMSRDPILVCTLVEYSVDPIVKLSTEDSALVLLFAVDVGSDKLIRYLTLRGADLNVVAYNGLPALKSTGSTALMQAARMGNGNIARCHIECGANPNSTNVEGTTALMVAASGGRIQLLCYLLENGADVNAADRSRSTALMQAVGIGSDKVVRCLVECGADLNASSENGRTAAMSAAAVGDVKILHVLKCDHVDFNAVEVFGETALMSRYKAPGARRRRLPRQLRHQRKCKELKGGEQHSNSQRAVGTKTFKGFCGQCSNPHAQTIE